MVDGVSGGGHVGNVQFSTGKMSLETLVTLVLTERQEFFDTEVRSKVSNMREKNAQLKSLGEAMASITERKKLFGKSSPSSSDIINKRGDKEEWEARRTKLTDTKNGWGTGAEWYKNASAWVADKDCTWSADTKQKVLEDIELGRLAQENGVNTGKNGDPLGFAVNNHTYGALEALEAKLNAQKDTLTNDTQLDQIELQSMMGKLTNITSLLSTMIKKFDDSHADIIRRV